MADRIRIFPEKFVVNDKIFALYINIVFFYHRKRKKKSWIRGKFLLLLRFKRNESWRYSSVEFEASKHVALDAWIRPETRQRRRNIYAKKRKTNVSVFTASIFLFFSLSLFLLRVYYLLFIYLFLYIRIIFEYIIHRCCP